MQRKHWHVIIEQLKNRPHARGAEIGIFRGIFARALLANLPDIQTYYCIDPWEHYDEYLEMLRQGSTEIKIPPSQAYRIFLKNTERWRDKTIILRKMSQDALVDVPDESLDWVFIDANHVYVYAREDIIQWSRKVKIGGIVSGHDFYDRGANARRDIPFGVEKAVRELIQNYKVEGNTWYTVKETESCILLAT